MGILGLVALISGCGPSIGFTYRLDTNQNDFRMYPLDVKKPLMIAPEEKDQTEDEEDKGNITDKTKQTSVEALAPQNNKK